MDKQADMQRLHHPAVTPPIMGERWPVLKRAMSRYSEHVAEEFSRTAYQRIDAGILRQDDRRALTLAAKQLEIREFDAQLLIACAVRQWSLDHRFDPSPSPDAPKLSFEYKSWKRVWARIAIVLGTATALDAIILWKMFH